MPTGRAGERDRRRGGTSSTRRPADSTRERRPRGEPGGRTASRRRPGGKARPSAGTGGAFRLSSTRRAAVLAILVCAMALSVSVPLRTYLGQRDELAELKNQEDRLSSEVHRLAERRTELSDPRRLEIEARERLGYVRPGETPYIVDLPSQPPEDTAERDGTEQDGPWYQRLWNTLTGGEGK
ncbi:FtsB family cell division protein [Actinopolyspora mortivallis]|uniref:FtsB family cell division protein n=1 Tax=Actinopolyspora mortivallis TaxID=33906 RepID=UPI00037659C4|nr:septum formation initiator family protein [Actinopolyspora mortivallis]